MGLQPLLSLPFDSKIQIFGNVIVATTGAVGLSQRLSAHIEEAIAGGVFNGQKRRECITNISRRVLTDFGNSLVQNHPQRGLGFGALIATVHGNAPFLAEYATTDFQPEIKEGNLFFVSMGSGQMLADPFLAFVSRVLWKSQMPTVADGKFGVYWVLKHAITLAPGGVGGPSVIATLQKVNNVWTAATLEDLQEADEYITELESHIGKFARTTIEEAPAVPIPTPQVG
jgi:hypothetical protein